MPRSTISYLCAAAVLAGGVSFAAGATPGQRPADFRVAQQKQPPTKPQFPEQKLPQPKPGIEKPGQELKGLKLPDLIVSGIAVPYGRTLTPGQNLGELLRVAAKNVGNAPAPGTKGSLDPANGYVIDVVLSTDRRAPVRFARYSASFHEDVLLKGGRFSNTADLGPGDRKSYRDNSAVIPTDIEPGTYYFCAVIDPGKKVNESDERNNVQCGSSVEIGPPKAGAAPGDATGPGPGGPGGFTGGAPDLIVELTNPMSAKVTVRNVGSAGAGASKLVLTCDSPVDSHPGGGGGCPESPGLAAYSDPAFPDHPVVNVPPIPAGGSYSHNLTFFPDLDWLDGVTYQFTAEADAADDVAESNEGNNGANSTLTGP